MPKQRAASGWFLPTRFYLSGLSSISADQVHRPMRWLFGLCNGPANKSVCSITLRERGNCWPIRSMNCARKVNPICYLPHDGINANNITGKRYRDHLEEAGFDAFTIPNQGRGAAMMRIEAVRRILP